MRIFFAVFASIAFFSTREAPQLLAASPVMLSQLRDSTLTVGTLPNGMRYYIKVNASPAKRARLWLAVHAGAINEDDDQRGYAHFLEHMAFNGTRQFPGNTLIDVIEQAGMTFGADLNAYTSFDETVYQLTMPTDDLEIFRKGFDILTDWADGSILSDSLAVAGERGVVLGEWRVRRADTSVQRIQINALKRIFGEGSKYVDRLPIGTVEALQAAVPAPLQRFYKDWYRPDLMAVIAVGDFDPEMVKQEIFERFGKISMPNSPRSFKRPAIPASDQTIVHIVKDKVRPQVEMYWSVPSDDGTPESALRLKLLEEILFPIVQRKLTKLSKQEQRPFAGAAVGRTKGITPAMRDQYMMRVVSMPDSLKGAMISVIAEFERIAQNGMPDSELELQKTILLRRYEAAAAGATATGSLHLAQLYTRHYLSGTGHLLSPSQELELAQKILPTISSDDLALFAGHWRTPANRTVTYSVPPVSGVHPVTEEHIHTLLDSLVTTKLDVTNAIPIVAQANSNTSLISIMPKGGKIIKEETVSSINATTWTLSNGARVVFKRVDNNPDDIKIYAHSLGGHSLLPDSLFFTSPRLVGMLMTAAGGLGGMGSDQLRSELSGTAVREFRVDLNAFEEEVAISGSPRELETLFQLMYLQFTNPTIDTTSLLEWRRTGGSTLRMTSNDRLAVRMSGHRRLGPPQPVNVTFVDLDQAMNVYRERFGDASDFTFYIVGAASPDQIKPLIEQYVASLPSTNRTTRETAKNFEIPLMTQRRISENRHPGLPAERAQTAIMFAGALDAAPETHFWERSRLQALSWILSRRLRNRLREEMAVTYSAGAPVQIYKTPDVRYVISISVVTSPDDMDSAVKATWEEIDSLRMNGPTDEELSMVATIQRRAVENARESNAWWIARMQSAEELGIPLDQLGLKSSTAFTGDEIIAAAMKYLPKDVYAQSTMLPTKATIAKAKEKSDAKQDSAGDNADESAID